MSGKKKCIIFGAGEFHKQPKNAAMNDIPDYEEGDTVIAVDGGLFYCGLLNIEPDIIIGDFDSLDDELLQAVRVIEEKYPEKILRLKPEKDDTDMLVALKWGLAKGHTLFQIYGGLGGRLDHSLANIQCLLYLKRQGAEGYLFEENGMVCVAMASDAEDVKQFHPSMEGMLSLFSLEAESVVSISHMKYPLSRYRITNDFPIGISNEFLLGESGCITVHSGAVVLMLKWPGEKQER